MKNESFKSMKYLLLFLALSIYWDHFLLNLKTTKISLNAVGGYVFLDTILVLIKTDNADVLLFH